MTEDDSKIVILLVDDEPDNLAFLARTLRAVGDIVSSQRAEEARGILAQHAIDVLVTDQRLPGETGVSLLEYARDNYPAVRRILVTGYGESPSVVDACRDGRIERFILKPFTPDSMKSAVRDVLRARGTIAAPRVLVACSEEGTRESLAEELRSRRIDVLATDNGPDAIRLATNEEIEAAVVELDLDEIDGLHVLQALQRQKPDLPVLIMSNDERAVEAGLLDSGPFDFLSQPPRKAELIFRVERALSSYRRSLEHRRVLEQSKARQRSSSDLICESAAMQSVVDIATNAARHDITVLLQGETGTGKEVLARYIHDTGKRASGPFVPVNCGAFPEQLADSILFGHEKGAFTDAKERRAGVFEAAEGGTIFLDEIGEMMPQSQVRLLRVLENRELTRVGGTKQIPVNVRVVAASHKKLLEMVSEGRFRQDLYYRLSSLTIQIPPLRERTEDIPALLEFAVTRFCHENQVPVADVTQEAMRRAMSYDWPGNVRELLHVVQRTLITRGTDKIIDFDFEHGPSSAGVQMSGALSLDYTKPLKDALGPVLDDLEKNYLVGALEHCNWHLGNTANHAGIHRKSLYNKMKKLGIRSPDGSTG